MRFLTENTLIPIGLAITVIGGASIWLTNIWWQGQANAAQIERLNTKQEAYLATLIEIRSDVAVIKSRLERKEK